MSIVLDTGQSLTIFLPIREGISIVSVGSGSGAALKYDYTGVDLLETTAVDVGETKLVRGQGGVSRYLIVCSVGTLEVTQEPLVLETGAESAAAAALAYVGVLGIVGDVREIIGEEAPDGATGVDVAGTGSRYTDITAGKLYINGGTKAAPSWKIVTSA